MKPVTSGLKKKPFLQPFYFKHGIFNPLKHTYYSKSVYGRISTSARQQEEEMVLQTHEGDHRSWELHSFGPDFTASMWIHNTTSCPDVPQVLGRAERLVYLHDHFLKSKL